MLGVKVPLGEQELKEDILRHRQAPDIAAQSATCLSGPSPLTGDAIGGLI